MKILILSHIFHPATDGGSKILYQLSQKLKTNHQILVVTSNCKSTDDFINPKSATLETSSRNIIRLPVYKRLRRPLKLINLILKSSHLSILQKGPVFKIIPSLKTLFIIKNFKPDLIISGPFPTAINLYALLLKNIFHTKLLTAPCFHHQDPLFQNNSLTRVLQKSDLIWALTNFEKKYFKTKLSIHSQKILPIGAGINTPFLVNPKNISFPLIPNILFIGSFSAHKNIILLIDAFTLLFQNSPSPKNCHLTLAGQKTLYYPTIKKHLKNIPQKVRQRIHFVINFKSHQLKQLIDQSTVLVLPSREESFGLVLVETWARGKPVIVNHIPTLKELVNKTNGGLTFRHNSSKNLYFILQKLLDNHQLQKDLGLNGFNYVSNHLTWDKISKRLWSEISS